MPIADPAEMGSNVPDAVKRLKERGEYKKAFEAAFDDGVTAGNLGKALACFERTLVRGDSAVDRFRRKGEHHALTHRERHGLWLYESKGQCWRCHSGANFTDESYHNTGVAWGAPDLGRFAATKNEADRGKFKTPSLRGVALTAPYMHDGSMKTLEDVIAFYSKGGNENPNRDARIAPLELSAEEIEALVAFLKARCESLRPTRPLILPTSLPSPNTRVERPGHVPGKLLPRPPPGGVCSRESPGRPGGGGGVLVNRSLLFGFLFQGIG